MPRKPTIRTNEHPYHIVSRSRNRDWYDLDLTILWPICLDLLKKACRANQVNPHAFVLMSNHYHLIIDTPLANIDRFMFDFNRNLSNEIRMRSGRINQIFGGRYKWSIIEEQNYYYHVLKYVFRNPIKANICTNIDAYPYSSFNLKNSNNEYVKEFKPWIDMFKNEFYEWLNLENNEDDILIRSALSKAKFKLPINQETRKSTVLNAVPEIKIN